MTTVQSFFWGAGASLGLEIVCLWEAMKADPAVQLAPRYRSIAYWLVRVLLACIGGGLAVAYQGDQPFVCVGIGAATPVILRRLGSILPQLPPSSTS